MSVNMSAGCERAATMQFDTDILIWLFRGHDGAARLMEKNRERHISVVSYMELLQGARDKTELRTIKSFLSDFGFQTLPLTENIGHRALIYIEEYGLKAGICVADALVAATAVENHLTLATANRKHYRPISDLVLLIFRP
jgi:predicted nucleic acid-binding protein